MTVMDSPIQSKELHQVFALLEKKRLGEASVAINAGIERAQQAKDKILEGLFYSAQGVLFKLQKEFRKAWKAYESAEKLIPEDPALKIISSQLLLEYFGQYDIVIRKMERVLQLVGDDAIFAHQAHTLLGLAYLKQGKKEKTKESLETSMAKNFAGLRTALNINLQLVSAMMKKKWEAELCRQFLQSALAFSEKTREAVFIKQFRKILADLGPSA